MNSSFSVIISPPSRTSTRPYAGVSRISIRWTALFFEATCTAAFIENPEPTSAFGTKALGEPPACSGAPAIRNAIYNATGVALHKLPMNPHNLFAAFKEAGLIHDSWED